MFIKREIIDQVGVLTIDRQDVLNAVNPPVLRELDQAVKDYIADENVGAIILTGAVSYTHLTLPTILLV